MLFNFSEMPFAFFDLSNFFSLILWQFLELFINEGINKDKNRAIKYKVITTARNVRDYGCKVKIKGKVRIMSKNLG